MDRLNTTAKIKVAQLGEKRAALETSVLRLQGTDRELAEDCRSTTGEQRTQLQMAYKRHERALREQQGARA